MWILFKKIPAIIRIFPYDLFILFAGSFASICKRKPTEAHQLLPKSYPEYDFHKEDESVVVWRCLLLVVKLSATFSDVRKLLHCAICCRNKPAC